MVYTDAHWRKFSAFIGMPELMDTDARFRNLASRTVHAEEMGAFLAAQLPTRSTADWIAFFAEADIPAGPVNSVDDLLTDPHLQAVGFWEEIDHPTEGRLRVTRFPGSWSRTQPDIRRLAPNLGEHNRDVLQSTAGARSQTVPDATTRIDP